MRVNGPQERGRAGASATGDAHDPTSVLEEAVIEDEEYRIIGPKDMYSPRADPFQHITVANSDEALDNTPPPMTEPLRTEVIGMPEWSNMAGDAEPIEEGVADQLPEEERRDTTNDGPLYWEQMSISALNQKPGESGGEKRSMRPKRGVDRYTPGAYITFEKSWSEESRRPRQLRVLREPERVILVSARQYAFTLTVQKALRTYKEKAEESIMKEMVNRLEKDVFFLNKVGHSLSIAEDRNHPEQLIPLGEVPFNWRI
jgi:hypothetical protein